MKKITLVISLLVTSCFAYAGGDYFDVKVIDFSRVKENEYRFEFVQLSQPYGKKHKKDERLVVNLRYKCMLVICSKSMPSNIDFEQSIKHLSVIAVKDAIIKFGVVAGGYQKIKGNEYQSNGLELYEGVAYSYEMNQ